MKSNPIKRFTTKELSEKETRLEETYKNLKPYLVRLFTHAILLFITIRAYNSFKDSKETYNSFIELLDRDLLVNVTEIELEDECESGWVPIDSVKIPEIINGCRCDDVLYPYDSCQSIILNNSYKEDVWKANCNYLDNIIDQSDKVISALNKTKYGEVFNITFIKEIPPEFRQNYTNKEKISIDQNKFNDDTLMNKDTSNDYGLSGPPTNVPNNQPSMVSNENMNNEKSKEMTNIMPTTNEDSTSTSNGVYDEKSISMTSMTSMPSMKSESTTSK